MNRTKTTVRVANVLLSRPTDRHWGYDLSREAHVRSGVMYPMLSRFLDAGWLEDGWEDIGTTKGRPPRRYYRVTDAGRVDLAALVEERGPRKRRTV